ncbi:MAG: rhomboid family intramembrane serine protease [Deltaproteobacteria bacterium]
MPYIAKPKNSMLCPHCHRLISKDEKRCPYCGTSAPASWWKNISFLGIVQDPRQFVKLIITVNVVMYVLSLLLDPRGMMAAQSFGLFSFLSPSNRSLVLLGATGTIPVLQLHRYWSLLAANYLHGSLLHILFNMVALWQLGPLAVREFGGWRMFVIYTLGGVFGFVASVFAGVPLTIGASAAICSLIGAMLYFGKSRGGTYGHAIYSQLLGWAITIFAFGFLVPDINNWGHGGGMAAGALLAYLFSYQEKKRERKGIRILGVCCMVVTALVLLWAVGTGFLYMMMA